MKPRKIIRFAASLTHRSFLVNYTSSAVEDAVLWCRNYSASTNVITFVSCWQAAIFKIASLHGTFITNSKNGFIGCSSFEYWFQRFLHDEKVFMFFLFLFISFSFQVLVFQRRNKRNCSQLTLLNKDGKVKDRIIVDGNVCDSCENKKSSSFKPSVKCINFKLLHFVFIITFTVIYVSIKELSKSWMRKLK